MQPVLKGQITSLSLSEKLATSAKSLDVLTETQSGIVRLQQGNGGMTVPKVRHSPETLLVMDAMHEAANQIAARIDDSNISTDGRLKRAIWPAIVKFVGKGFMSLVLANLWLRNGVWAAHASDAAWVDDTTRFWDALAASLKLLTHVASQAYAESCICRM